jgi:hypothetical protein
MKRLIFLFFIFPLFVWGQKNYFQQEANYKIRVRLDDRRNMLLAYESIEYTNHSPDTLTSIRMHLWPNAYANNHTDLAKQLLNSSQFRGSSVLFLSREKRGFIDSLDFKVDGLPVVWDYYSDKKDICRLYLREALLPGVTIRIETPFRVKIPSAEFSRLGFYKQSYQITQWYPKPAVYDRYGWHEMPYLNQGEFYSEFGSFEVEISVPQNYVVAATGNLLNENEMAFLLRKAKDTEAIADYDLNDDSFPPSSRKYKTLLYKEKNIHDFAWFADKRFHVLQGQVKLPHSGKTVTTWVYYPNKQAGLWKDAIEYVNQAVYYYSLWYGDYPYDQCTAVHAPLSAGGGMEYPTITVIADMGSARSVENVIAHEVGHNWFYGILASNEREHPWMDEGINSFSDQRYSRATRKKISANTTKIRKNSKNEVSLQAGQNMMDKIIRRSNLHQGFSLSSEQYSEMEYVLGVYGRVASYFWYAMDYLGEEKFTEIMQDYYQKWKFKHPYPEDLKKIFEEHTKENWDWFFEHLLKTNECPDYSLKRKDDKFLLKQNSKFLPPVNIDVYRGGDVNSMWVKPKQKETLLNIKDLAKVQMISIDEAVADLYPRNSTVFPQQKIPAYKPLRLSMYHIMESADKTYLNFIPIMGYNAADGMMLGLWINKAFVPLPKLEVHLLPMYAFGSKSIAGTGAVNYHYMLSKSRLHEVEFHFGAKSFSGDISGKSRYVGFKSGAKLYFYPDKSGNESTLSVYWTSIKNPSFDADKYFAMNIHHFLNIDYDFEYFKQIHPRRFHTGIEFGKSYGKLSIEGEYKVHYLGRYGLNMRLFFGTFLYRKHNVQQYHFSLAGGAALRDYRYDHWYLNRYPDASSKNLRQYYKGEGNFTLGENITSSFLAAANFTLDLPSKFPVKLYANLAYGESIGGCLITRQIFYESGVKISFYRDTFEVYFPLAYSEYLADKNLTYAQKISFAIDVNKLKMRDIIKIIR